MTLSDQWLQFAPKPPDLTGGQTWHVFLSYRSVHRPWVIQLYDVLRHLGFEVFLDQYVLSASSALISGLAEGLEKSGSGSLYGRLQLKTQRGVKKSVMQWNPGQRKTRITITSLLLSIESSYLFGPAKGFILTSQNTERDRGE